MMNSRKTLGVAGAAAMAFLAGAGTAHAAFNLDTGAGKAAYARESVTGTVTVSSDTYYVVSGPATGPGAGRLRATVPLDAQIADGTTVTVTVTLGNMVFAGTNTPSFHVGSTAFTTLSSGGTSGDATAVFSITPASGSNFAAATTMTLRIRSVALASQSALGSVTVTLTDSSNNELQTDTLADAIRFQSGVRESGAAALPRVLMGEGFRTFESGDNVRTDGLAASVGTLDVKALGRYPDTDDGTPLAEAAGSTVVNALADVLDADASTVTVTGDVSFATGVFWYDNADCTTESGGTAPTNLLTIGNDGTRTLATASVTAADGKHLCLEVDGVTSIPRTAPYELEIDYTGITNAQFPPVAGNVTLGAITRGGATAHIPYLTTFSAYNQRIVVVNRGSEPVGYAFEFIQEGHATRNTTPIAQDSATGTLQPGVTNFRTRDILDFTEDAQGRKWPRAGAILTVDASPEIIDVITNQVNTQAGGTTDTVKYTVE